MVRFSLRQLEYFIAIAEAGTLSAAADRLHVSQPGLSQSLTDLERALGVQLAMRRRAHGVALTPTGLQVLRASRELLAAAADLDSIASGDDLLRGSLSIGCYVTLAPTALPPLMEGFSTRHPHLTVNFTEGTQNVLQQQLLTGELDVAVLYDMEVDPSLARTVIDSVRPHILLSANHPLAESAAVSLSDLSGEPMVLLDAPPSSQNTLHIFEDLGLTPQVRYRPTTLELTRALVGRGMGYALLVQRPSNEHTYDGRRVVIKEIAEPVSDARVILAWPQETRLGSRAQAFVDFCRATSSASTTDDTS